MIEYQDVSKEYEGNVAVQHINLTVADGEFFVLVGPSGSGKTTLLKMINGLNVPTAGKILIDGQQLTHANVLEFRHSIGYVLQAGALFPNMTVEQNASLQLDLLKWDHQAAHDRVSQLFKLVGLDPETYLQRFPNELSGGESQRVGIVRALASQPKIVLMDEPFSALDPISRKQLQDLVARLHRELDTTFVFVTHDMQEALGLADRLAVIHDSNLVQVGKPQDILAHPQNQFVRDFFEDKGTVNIFLQQVLDAGFGTPSQGQAAVAMTDNQTIFDWSRIVAQTPNQLVQVHDIILSQQDLVNYMATQRVGVVK